MRIETGFGWIRISDRQYEEDIIVSSDERVLRRPKELSASKRKLYNHTPFTVKELTYLLEKFGFFEILIIGTGQMGLLPVEQDVFSLAKSKGIKIITKKTPIAIKLFTNLAKKKKVVAVFHVTC